MLPDPVADSSDSTLVPAMNFPPAPPPTTKTPGKSKGGVFSRGGALRPGRLLRSDLKGIGKRWGADWTFDQLVLAAAVYVFFTNLLPGITFASDLYVLTDKHYGAIEVVFSTGLCGCIFALYLPPPWRIWMED